MATSLLSQGPPDCYFSDQFPPCTLYARRIKSASMAPLVALAPDPLLSFHRHRHVPVSVNLHSDKSYIHRSSPMIDRPDTITDPVMVPTRGGVYVTTVPLTVVVSGQDEVILGQDWLRLSRAQWMDGDLDGWSSSWGVENCAWFSCSYHPGASARYLFRQPDIRLKCHKFCHMKILAPCRHLNYGSSQSSQYAKITKKSCRTCHH